MAQEQDSVFETDLGQLLLHNCGQSIALLSPPPLFAAYAVHKQC